MLLFRSLTPIRRRRQFARRERRRIGQRVQPTKNDGISIATTQHIAYDDDDMSLHTPLPLDHIDLAAAVSSMRANESAVHFAPNVTAINLPFVSVSSPSIHDDDKTEHWCVEDRYRR